MNKCMMMMKILHLRKKHLKNKKRKNRKNLKNLKIASMKVYLIIKHFKIYHKVSIKL